MERFNNPKMPAWLEFGLLKAFQDKNIEHIKGYHKLWEELYHGKR
jgi:hypothetical protein